MIYLHHLGGSVIIIGLQNYSDPLLTLSLVTIMTVAGRPPEK